MQDKRAAATDDHRPFASLTRDTEDAEDRRLISDVGGQTAEGRGQMSDVRSRRSEGGGQMTEDRGQMSEACPPLAGRMSEGR